MLKLYGFARSRASIVRWYLEELAVEYEDIQLDMEAGEHKKTSYIEINPMGQVPALTDGDFKVWESGAILLFLADKYGKLPSAVEAKAEIYQWILFANSSLSMGLVNSENRHETMARYLQPIDSILRISPFMLGNEFTVVDVAIGSILAYISMLFQDIDLTAFPNIQSYLTRLGDRPAFRKTIMNNA